MEYVKGILLSILMISFLSINAQERVGSDIVFKDTIYQFGPVEEGSDAACVFSFINKSKTPVAITNVKTFCGCIDLRWTKEPVKPGQSGKISVKFHAGNTGTFSKTIKVFTTNSGEQSIDLTIRGSVVMKSGKNNSISMQSSFKSDYDNKNSFSLLPIRIFSLYIYLILF